MTIADMTEKQWYDTCMKVGMSFEKPYEDRDGEERTITHSGLCRAFAEVAHVWPNLSPIKNTCDHWFPMGPCSSESPQRGWTRKHDLLRATYAYFFAHMGKAEFMAMTGGV